MDFIKSIISNLTDQTVECANGYVTLAVSETAAFLWKKVKNFFKGNKSVPLEMRETVSSIELGDEIEEEELTKIFSVIPNETLRSWTDDSNNSGNYEVKVAYAENGATITIHGDVAGRDIHK